MISTDLFAKLIGTSLLFLDIMYKIACSTKEQGNQN
jgi:hypothetical protein